MTNILNIFLFVLFCSQPIFFAEDPDSTLTKINNNKSFTQEACRIFNVEKKILSSIIFVERRENYNWEDEAMDEYLAKVGLNSSIGFCQVKMKTAYWIEVQLNDTNSVHFPGQKYFNLLDVCKNSQKIIDGLQNDSLNIMHAAAYLRIIISRWENMGFPIDKRADILGTLYSTGLFYRNGEERKPNKNPKANQFGKLVLSAIEKFE